jgi:DNA-binding beta-propeller fold protein YncE
METVKTLPDAGLPYRVEFTPNGKYALVANPVAGTLDVFDAAKQELVKRIDATKGSVSFAAEGGAPAIGGITPHPDSRYVSCTEINAAAVALIDLDKGEVVGKYEASISPDGIAYSKIEVKG